MIDALVELHELRLEEGVVLRPEAVVFVVVDPQLDVFQLPLPVRHVHAVAGLESRGAELVALKR